MVTEQLPERPELAKKLNEIMAAIHIFFSRNGKIRGRSYLLDFGLRITLSYNNNYVLCIALLRRVGPPDSSVASFFSAESEVCTLGDESYDSRVPDAMRYICSLLWSSIPASHPAYEQLYRYHLDITRLSPIGAYHTGDLLHDISLCEEEAGKYAEELANMMESKIGPDAFRTAFRATMMSRYAHPSMSCITMAAIDANRRAKLVVDAVRDSGLQTTGIRAAYDLYGRVSFSLLCMLAADKELTRRRDDKDDESSLNIRKLLTDIVPTLWEFDFNEENTQAKKDLSGHNPVGGHGDPRGVRDINQPARSQTEGDGR